MTRACPRVTIVVLNYNGKAVIEKYVGSVMQQGYSNFETIVVDNNSSVSRVS